MVVFKSGVLQFLFIFGLCIIFLFRSYPYNIVQKRLCQHYLYKNLSKKYYKILIIFCLGWPHYVLGVWLLELVIAYIINFDLWIILEDTLRCVDWLREVAYACGVWHSSRRDYFEKNNHMIKGGCRVWWLLWLVIWRF